MRYRILHQLECDVRSTAFRRNSIQPAKAGTTNGLYRLMQNTSKRGRIQLQLLPRLRVGLPLSFHALDKTTASTSHRKFCGSPKLILSLW